MVIDDELNGNDETNVTDLTHDNVMDPELSELCDFTEDVKC